MEYKLLGGIGCIPRLALHYQQSKMEIAASVGFGGLGLSGLGLGGMRICSYEGLLTPKPS